VLLVATMFNRSLRKDALATAGVYLSGILAMVAGVAAKAEATAELGTPQKPAHLIISKENFVGGVVVEADGTPVLLAPNVKACMRFVVLETAMEALLFMIGEMPEPEPEALTIFQGPHTPQQLLIFAPVEGEEGVVFVPRLIETVAIPCPDTTGWLLPMHGAVKVGLRPDESHQPILCPLGRLSEPRHLDASKAIKNDH
jgi:hypothetical protein